MAGSDLDRVLSRLAADPAFAARVAADPVTALADLRLSAADLAVVEGVVAPAVPDPLSESGVRLRRLLEGGAAEDSEDPL
ncbi:hypothetical protein GCM10009839_48920 [Catenulispora yoronensis]|uniref:Uncharacterized protein n=1 Tax=Catenulispora yoronensis TaxID=450799 RepID=A0ABN2UNY6_9ACTN